MSKLSIVRFGAVVCAAAFLAGCETSNNADSGQMGVVGGETACASACSSEAKACSGEAKTCSGEAKSACSGDAAKECKAAN